MTDLWDIFQSATLVVRRGLSTEAVLRGQAAGEILDDDLARPAGTSIPWTGLADVPELNVRLEPIATPPAAVVGPPIEESGVSTDAMNAAAFAPISDDTPPTPPGLDPTASMPAMPPIRDAVATERPTWGDRPLSHADLDDGSLVELHLTREPEAPTTVAPAGRFPEILEDPEEAETVDRPVPADASLADWVGEDRPGGTFEAGPFGTDASRFQLDGFPSVPDFEEVDEEGFDDAMPVAADEGGELEALVDEEPSDLPAPSTEAKEEDEPLSLGGGGPTGGVEDLDLTAMADIAMQMIMFLLVAATVVTFKSLEIPTPNPDEGRAVAQEMKTLEDLMEDFILVEIGADGTVQVDREAVPTEQLLDRLRRARTDTLRTSMLLSAEFSTPHANAVAALDAANEIGLAIALAKPTGGAAAPAATP